MKDLLIYKCEVCGYILEVIDLGKKQLIESGTSFARTITVADAKLICCGKPMTLVQANSVDASNEKHVPIIEFGNDTAVVKVGSISHPMTPEHFIKWITILYGDRIQRVELEPGDTPEASFHIGNESNVKAYAYCNLHGLWMSSASRQK
ncbi:desulfoferrodoxin family protein [Pectinatus haikarae]|uniref:Desulfoferrodoxin n=1 Tax=Pectinatus haikarae TaxID=349096 RepID=A0ABT9Y3N3_9FIRM|nr:desulfoferrodoxin family protein [Pectinatus haikarae]MDQ0202435.1 superoxide reductase [Pectinatus haikarae]